MNPSKATQSYVPLNAGSLDEIGPLQALRNQKKLRFRRGVAVLVVLSFTLAGLFVLSPQYGRWGFAFFVLILAMGLVGQSNLRKQ